ncbi:hypothetical protein [Acinetobacter venetianus]|uniref:hypothetical protein n=1 Tax=Acinetobacter venetianus TaxID=52133 RepID=UPI0007785B4A|nr:hypothetical protein [Acinetobacter venetianus]KXZ65092.1 hypothetical protein AVENLUH7437_01585 [Acinetobacter venetianus]RZG78683.1 hypothetical protein EXE23_15350 [Acinetobacter venetianus]
MFEEREIQYIWPEDYNDLLKNDLPNIVFKLNDAGRIAYIDLGTIFYKKHTRVYIKTHTANVYKNTLWTELIDPLHEYILEMTQKYAHASIKHFLKVIRNVVKDLHNLYDEIELHKKEKALELYQKYTQYLVMDRASKLKDSIADMGIYNRKQTILAEILSRSLNMSIYEVKNSFIEIASKHKNHNQPVDNEIFIKFFELNKVIYQKISDFFVNNRKLPIEIKCAINNIDDIFFYFNKNDEAIGKYTNKIQRSHIKMINLGCSAFVNCFACVTAINTAQIYNLSINDINNLEASTKGIRVSSIKPRAGYKKIKLSIPLKFKEILKDFLQFRLHIQENFNFDNRNTENKDLLFFGLNNPMFINENNYIIQYSETQHSLYKKWFSSEFPQVEWVPLNKLRATIANIYHNESKSLLSVAKKLGNTPQVVSTSYSEATEAQVLSEMTNTFNSIAQAAPILVSKPTVKFNLETSLDTDMGHCVSKEPNLDINYHDADLDTPNCSNPISCLFCENYVVHTNRDDIHKLLSAKKIFEMANSSQNSENIYLVIQKINEVLQSITSSYPLKEQEIDECSKLISLGKLTPFFEIMLNTLTDLGIDFYE